MRSRIWALVSGRELFGVAELAATADRCWAGAGAAELAASLATPGAGAPMVAPPAAAGAGGGAALRFVVVDSGTPGGGDIGKALQATAPSTTRAQATVARRTWARRGVKGRSMGVDKPR